MTTQADWLPLSDPDMSLGEIEAVTEVLKSPRFSQGAVVEAFEAAFAVYSGRRHAVAVPSGTLAPEKAAEKVTPRTRAILAGNIAGHQAAWQALRGLAAQHELLLIEDSTEAIGSRYQGRLTGGFGDFAVFDFSQPSALCCGEGGMVLTDDGELAGRLRMLRSRRPAERFSVSIGHFPPFQATMSEFTAALGLAQLRRIDEILARRRRVEGYYLDHIRSFEGIKPPYLAPEVDEAHWFLYLVHLGIRFTRSSRDAIVEDLHNAGIDAQPYCQPLHAHLTEDEVAFIVKTAKDASVNVGASAAIYL